jgi:hypothetical protein
MRIGSSMSGGSPASPPTPARASARPETAAPPPRPRPRPHPLRQRHRWPTCRLQRGLAGHRSPRLRPAHWTQTLSLSRCGVAEPKTPRLRLLAITGPLIRSGRRTQLRLDRRWPWAATVATVATVRAFPDPGLTTPPLARRPWNNAPAREPDNNHTPNTITGERTERRQQPQITKDRG